MRLLELIGILQTFYIENGDLTVLNSEGHKVERADVSVTDYHDKDKKHKENVLLG